MAEFSIDGEVRTVIGKKVNRLRRQGIVPIVVYGPKVEPVNLQVEYRELELALQKAGGTNLIEIRAGGENYNVLARDVQRDVIRGEIQHVDFLAIDANTRLNIDVPVVMLNESPAVAARKGILITGPNFLSIETRANNIINQIPVDLSLLKEVGDSIYVRDLDLGEVNILNDPEEMLARVSQTSAARRELMDELMSGGSDEQVTDDEMPEPEIIGESKDDE